MTENAADSNDTNVEDEQNFNKPEEIVNALRSVSFIFWYLSLLIYIYIPTPYIHNNMIILYIYIYTTVILLFWTNTCWKMLRDLIVYVNRMYKHHIVRDSGEYYEPGDTYDMETARTSTTDDEGKEGDDGDIQNNKMKVMEKQKQLKIYVLNQLKY